MQLFHKLTIMNPNKYKLLEEYAMFNIVKESIYKKGWATKDAKALLPVLGNEEEVMKVIEQRSLNAGKWRYIVKELYALLQGDDKALLLQNGYALEMGEYTPLWKVFAHHEEARLEAMPNPLDIYTDAIIAEAKEANFDLAKLSAMLQAKIQVVEGTTKEEEKATVSEDEKESDGADVQTPVGGASVEVEIEQEEIKHVSNPQKVVHLQKKKEEEDTPVANQPKLVTKVVHAHHSVQADANLAYVEPSYDAQYYASFDHMVLGPEDEKE